MSVENPLNVDVTPDRFDIDNFSNPSTSRPNNNVPGRSVVLGDDSLLSWRSMGTTPNGEQWELKVSNLNFHTVDDVDWFILSRIPPTLRISSRGGICSPLLEILYGRNPGFFATATSSLDGSRLGPVTRDRSFVDRQIVGRLAANAPLLIKLERDSARAEGNEYELILRFFSITRTLPGC